MPELHIGHSYKYTVLRLKQEWKRHHWGPLSARITIRSRETCADAVCTVDNSPEFDYDDSLEPVQHPPPESTQATEDSAAQPLTRQVVPGELFVKVRGGEVVFAAGYHAIRVDLGRGGSMTIVPNETYAKVFSDEQNSIAAIVGEEHTFAMVDPAGHLRFHVMSLSRPWTEADLRRGSSLWPKLWSATSGPDWIDECEEAEEALDRWRKSVLSGKAVVAQAEITSRSKKSCGDSEGCDIVNDEDEVEACLVEDAPSLPSLLDVMLNTPSVFNGYGPHTAQDLLYQLGIWPTMPPENLCADNTAFAEFKAALVSYAAQFVSSVYRTRCLKVPTYNEYDDTNPQRDENYYSQYLKVFRKCTIRIPRDLYNEYVKRGLLDPSHTIGEPYSYNEDDLIFVKYREVPVYQYSEGSGEPIYSVICARRPPGWKYSGASVISQGAQDVRHPGSPVVVGPNAFHIYLNRNPPGPDSDAADTPGPSKGGRRPTVRTGRPGRPAKGRPRAADVRQRASQARIEMIHERAVKLASSSNAPSDVAGSGRVGSGMEENPAPPRKRIRYGRTYNATTDSRRTRSTSEAHT
ncbi:hypothetical protein GY45DRAFT_1282616 [Cubamyces sp. BRFM 1775]|nr:hypothetical protein GY45DRAFT_1282616 [Cubamyces sp. BRFM 1775]